MRSVRAYAVAALAVWTAAVMVGAQGKVSTPAEYDKVMKAVGAANGAMRKAVMSGAWAEAKTAVGTIRQNLTMAETFWVANKKDEAVKLTKEAVAKAEALDKVLGASTVDTAAVTTAMKELGGTCQTCHKGWRVQDAEGNYSINPEKMK
jgi:cytochrome c556